MKHMVCSKKKCLFFREKITTQIFKIIKCNIKPEFVEFDTYVLEDMMKNAGFSYVLIEYYQNMSELWNPNLNKTSIFSWSFMVLQLAQLYKQYVVEWNRKIRKCPACGSKLKSINVNDVNPMREPKINLETPKPVNVTRTISDLLAKYKVEESENKDLMYMAEESKQIKDVKQIIERIDKGV